MITAFINKLQPGKRLKVIPEGYAGTNVYHSMYMAEPQNHYENLGLNNPENVGCI
jgi:hypothetical protein